MLEGGEGQTKPSIFQNKENMLKKLKSLYNAN
jgi:hypothetical protein